MVDVSLVIGGAGFIGSNLVGELLEKGEEVIVLDSLDTGNERNLEEFKGKPLTLHIGRVSKDSIKNIFKTQHSFGNEIRTIYYLGMPSSSPMYKNDKSLVGRTINEAISLFEVLRKEKWDGQLVLTSSSSLYNGNPVPWHELMPIFPKDYYTETRYAIERFAEMYADQYGIKTVTLRLFSVYGEKEEFKGRYANMITQFIWAYIYDKPIFVYGLGEQARDFIYVKDVVDAFITASKHDLEDMDFTIFNIGTGRMFTFNEVLKLLALKFDVEPYYNVKYMPNPISNYVKHTLSLTHRCNRNLKWIAEHPLEKVIDKVIDYYKDLIDRGYYIYNMPKKENRIK